MPTQRVTMRKLRETLRLRLQAGLSIRAISRSTKLSVGGVQKLLSRAETLGLTWPLPADLDDTRLAALFYPGADTGSAARCEVPDWAAVHEELKRPHVTKRLAWEEYTQRYPNRAYSYSQFCDRYRHWLGRQQRTMRQTHKAGEKCLGHPGKTFIACALGHQACRQGHPTRYYRLSRLFLTLTQARADGSYHKLIHQLARTQLLILDDWGLEPLNTAQRHDLMHIMDDRYHSASTLIASQLPVDQWYHLIGDHTLADAILDRLIHNAHRLTLKGESMRKKQPAIDSS